LLNLGISGATMSDIAQQELPPALDARPQLITLWSGVNDLARQVPLPTFRTQLDEVLGQLRAASGLRATIVVLNLPNLHHVPVFGRVDAARLDQVIHDWNTAIDQVAQRHNAVVVDLYAEWPELADHPEYISADGFHPSSLGYERIAELVVEAINRHASSLS
jgi:lysophospholipase L1-like esterase